MKKSERMQVLVNLSQRKEDEVAKALAKDQARLQHDQQKLQELKDYAAQYDQERNLLGLSPYLTTNYQHFVNRLQQAIQQQDQQVKRSQQQVTMSMKRWQNARAKTKGMDWLKDKSVREELNIESKQEQKQIDEFANRAFFERMRS
ncbi:MAG: flagellar export protein FliJ [Marinomonas sp.]|jgi:flagellar FliJ protein|uniref:Flagellar FliJ protein n=1 Tax=Marinomonas communis TaxID=28254 RepID=A0A4R6X327_9GAMM|nr:flagellar export protein FliJ [Marinomonas communis]MAF16606.1 flagellar export protein FliJ [Marinomonas sp.]MEC8484982.1 flagellar export protein FliJ [Pseudomonadota bacterium]RUM48630.1 MAG: flagellar export protein FliJ [Marinomonas sp.]RUM55031.1 MAG: flagellar export protein FliJ [Marinomonas sp.]TDR13325.1 flagellar FliJ protein [Marinomonas communis]|tara:strand:+ start:1280 stop:1717 length:438 start_codon:yes stop_codon:yes gene_type:complete